MPSSRTIRAARLCTRAASGTKKARRIFQALAPANLDAVAALARAGALRELPGFGKISEQKVLQAIEERRL